MSYRNRHRVTKQGQNGMGMMLWKRRFRKFKKMSFHEVLRREREGVKENIPGYILDGIGLFIIQHRRPRRGIW